ncbi:hypothetical protein JRQ81_013209, partial [Phrynocephalus forsythii]
MTVRKKLGVHEIVLNNDAMKPSKLEDHLRMCHPYKTDKDLTYFKTLKEKLQKRTTTIRQELILPSIEEILKTVLHKPVYDILKRIPLNNNTVKD